VGLQEGAEPTSKGPLRTDRQTDRENILGDPSTPPRGGGGKEATALQCLNNIAQVIAMNREERRLFFQVNLSNIDNSSHDTTMLASIMVKQLPKHAPVLELTIHSLVSSSGNLLHVLIAVAQSIGSLGVRQPLVDTISKVVLPRLHSILQSFLQSNLMVRKSATRKRTIQPCNVSGLD